MNTAGDSEAKNQTNIYQTSFGQVDRPGTDIETSTRSPSISSNSAIFDGTLPAAGEWDHLIV
jgi:hypothetical protein